MAQDLGGAGDQRAGEFKGVAQKIAPETGSVINEGDACGQRPSAGGIRRGLDTILASISMDQRIKQRQSREKRRRAQAKSDKIDEGGGENDENNVVIDDDSDGEGTHQQSRYNDAVKVQGDDDDDEVFVDDDAMENVGHHLNEEMEGQDNIEIDSSENIDDDDGLLAEDLYCVLCNKLVSTAGQMADICSRRCTRWPRRACGV